MNITEQEIQSLKDTKNETQWNAACDAIKRARNGQYPPDWYAVVMMTGLAYEIHNRW